MSLLCLLINGAALIYGGIVDYRKREIPNAVPITLLATGLIGRGYILQRLLVMVIIALILWLTTKITKQELPGGDFKLLCALAFSSGLLTLLGTLFFAGLCAIIVGVMKHEPLKRNIPLCTYVAPAFLVMSVYLLI